MATISGAPAAARVLGFDPDDGTLALIDDKGQPRRIDLRATEARIASKAKLTSLTTVNGSDLFGITAQGSVIRISPTGDWTFEPPSPARWVFPQPNGSVVVAGVTKSKTELWLIRPTDTDIIETASLPLASRGIRTQVGDRIYFTVDSGLVGVRTRDLSLVRSIRFKAPIEAIVPTPSGDRLYVATKGNRTLSIIDRYSESVSETVQLPGPVAELRMDPLGQVILARPAGSGDSAWVIGVGVHSVIGTVKTEWRADLPSFAPGETIVTVLGGDVIFVEATTLVATRTVAGGARDFWAFLRWNGFRPRAAELDKPVVFDTPPDSLDDSSSVRGSVDSMSPPPLRDGSPSMVDPSQQPSARPVSYMVSFAAVLSEQKAVETAAGMTIGGAKPRVVATQSGGTTIYRVALGPYSTREEAERVGRDSRKPYWVYEERK